MSNEELSWFRTCAYCGDPLAAGVKYPVHTEMDEDGTLHLYSFCDEECKADWLDNR